MGEMKARREIRDSLKKERLLAHSEVASVLSGSEHENPLSAMHPGHKGSLKVLQDMRTSARMILK